MTLKAERLRSVGEGPIRVPRRLWDQVLDVVRAAEVQADTHLPNPHCSCDADVRDAIEALDPGATGA